MSLEYLLILTVNDGIRGLLVTTPTKAESFTDTVSTVLKSACLPITNISSRVKKPRPCWCCHQQARKFVF